MLCVVTQVWYLSHSAQRVKVQDWQTKYTMVGRGGGGWDRVGGGGIELLLIYPIIWLTVGAPL